MSAAQPHPNVQRALDLSHRIMQAAQNADAQALTALDDERAQLIKSFRLETRSVAAADRAALGEIVKLNDLALGLMEHHRRTKGRELDMAAVGRRAVTAYGQHVTQQR
jgi:hypothetical protein